MVMSMTGYGNESIQFDKTTITVEIKSVNHRFLDIDVKLSRPFLFMEEKIKKGCPFFF